VASLTRRLRKQAKARINGDVAIKGAELKKRILLEVLFGTEPAPSDEHESERFAIATSFQKMMAEFKTEQPARFWKYLLDHRRGYDPRYDGSSRAMELVDDVRALLEDEREQSAMKEIQA